MEPETRNSKLETEDVVARAKRIKVLLMDCDGVLTDGSLWLTEDYDEQKSFHARDGQGISLLHRAGLRTGIISGRKSSAVDRRAHDLKIAFVHQYAKDKVKALDEIMTTAGVSSEECAYIGDDLADIAPMRRVGFAVAVADAAHETKQVAHYVTALNGGRGAVREVADLILKAQGRWDELMNNYFID
ncbi:MAG TPA: HAD-IIIA family hydrolase [Pyrinomonadaceae bacterium]|nr:HAD-IIIA family hydrolase [Pyrinomonadaceae bacterium]